jgi:3-hydroxyisobutyrate dehydrogenase-like beta-hydroxyacid dehydrogenase
MQPDATEPGDPDERTTERQVAVVGLGAMGAPIAGHLSAAGLRPLIVDLDESLVAAGAAAGGVPADLSTAAASDVVLLTVASDADVRAVCLHEGLVAGMASGSVLCICSSVLPQTCTDIAAAAPGVSVLDTALTGGVRGAEAGAVNLLVGGDPAGLERARWAIAPWASTVHHLGDLGAGQVAKTVNNLLHWAQISAISEALELGRRYGLSVPDLRRALLDSPVQSRTLQELEHMRLTWHAKDLANALAMADQVELDVPVARTAQSVMQKVTISSLRELLTFCPDCEKVYH